MSMRILVDEKLDSKKKQQRMMLQRIRKPQIKKPSQKQKIKQKKPFQQLPKNPQLFRISFLQKVYSVLRVEKYNFFKLLLNFRCILEVNFKSIKIQRGAPPLLSCIIAQKNSLQRRHLFYKYYTLHWKKRYKRKTVTSTGKRV